MTRRPVDAVPTPPADRTVQREATVAILDTGIAEHPWFVSRKWFAACDDVREMPDTNGDDRLDSIAGHGTFIAGVILQQAPETILVVDRIVAFDGVSRRTRPAPQPRRPSRPMRTARADPSTS